MEKEVNCEILRPGDETKPFWVMKCCTNSEELQQKPRAEWVSKKETAEPDWIRSLILMCIAFNLNNAYVMLKIRAVTPSDLGVISDSYLKSPAHCAVASKKKVNKMLWIIWRDTVKGPGVVLPLHKPPACPHPVRSPGLGKVAAVSQGQLMW